MPEPTTELVRNLEGLRHLRGDDHAVVDIGSEADQQKLASVLADPLHHSREDLLKAIFANYSGEAYGDVHWPKKTGGWSSPEEPTEYGKMRLKYPALAPLSLDPGFMTHVDDIMKMLENGEISAAEFQATRSAIKDKLGSRTVFRGAMFTDDELALVRKSGIVSPLATFIANSTEPKEELKAKALSVYPSSAVESHFHGENYYTPFLSVSSHRDVAIAVGRHFGKRGPGKKFFLFELKIPTIDIIYYSESGIKMPSLLRESLERDSNHSIRIGINGSESQYKWDANVESFVFWKVDPADIVEITQPDVSESSWNGRKTLEV